MSWIQIVSMLPWKEILTKVWPIILPILEEKVEDTDSIWDDKALDAVKFLMERFLPKSPVHIGGDNYENYE